MCGIVIKTSCNRTLELFETYRVGANDGDMLKPCFEAFSDIANFMINGRRHRNFAGYLQPTFFKYKVNASLSIEDRLLDNGAIAQALG